MNYLIYLTERCNLQCKYCEPIEKRNKFKQDIDYDINKLIEFLNKDKNLSLHLYGGEPLLAIDKIKTILTKTNPNHVNLQTNGLLLNNLNPTILEKLNVISISIDGNEEITNSFRGKEVYSNILTQVNKLKNDGYKGMVNARMTVSPGSNIFENVTSILNTKLFDSVHWQLDALFNNNFKGREEEIKTWFKDYYNPGINRLISLWVNKLVRNHRLIQMVPFMGIMKNLITNRQVKNIYCGAGYLLKAITTTGEIFPCPVMRIYPKYSQGNIKTMSPEDIKPGPDLGPPCDSCDYLKFCGGRCLCANKENQWDKKGFELVCNSVKNLIDELIMIKPIVQSAIDQGYIKESDLIIYQDYEVIP